MNGYGDCGTMGLAFITLCRALGIPAKWQSGSACYPDSIGSHDWAQFYIAPYGWLYCDPSYGEGAARAGERDQTGSLLRQPRPLPPGCFQRIPAAPQPR